MNRFLGFLLALVLAACRSAAPVTTPSPATPVAAAQSPIVVLVSFDGWRHDYLERFNPPSLSALASGGVRADGLIPQFPSKTFPNHYTLVTGLRLTSHGIVSNNMVDADLPGRFAMSNREVITDPRWWGGEPIWNTAERAGQGGGGHVLAGFGGPHQRATADFLDEVRRRFPARRAHRAGS